MFNSVVFSFWVIDVVFFCCLTMFVDFVLYIVLIAWGGVCLCVCWVIGVCGGGTCFGWSIAFVRCLLSAWFGLLVLMLVLVVCFVVSFGCSNCFVW